MAQISTKDLRDKKVLSQDGHHIGEIDSLNLDIDNWDVVTVAIKLRRDVLESFNLERPLFGTQVVQIAIDQVSGVSEAMVLKGGIKDLAFVGGKGSPSSDS